jgi:SAM-dependent methyltransferase
MAADVLCSAEDLPFDDSSFDVVTCRLAAHHFENVEAGLAEMARVASHLVLVVDNLWMGAPDEEASRLRDPSHVRNYSADEWRALFARSGLEVEDERVGERRISFEPWLERTGTGMNEAARIRELLADRIEDGKLRIDRIALRGRKG